MQPQVGGGVCVVEALTFQCLSVYCGETDDMA